MEKTDKNTIDFLLEKPEIRQGGNNIFEEELSNIVFDTEIKIIKDENGKCEYITELS